MVILDPDPDWHSDKMLDPNPVSMNPDPNHWFTSVHCSKVMVMFPTQNNCHVEGQMSPTKTLSLHDACQGRILFPAKVSDLRLMSSTQSMSLCCMLGAFSKQCMQ